MKRFDSLKYLMASIFVLFLVLGINAQFTIPNNNVAFNANQSIWMSTDIAAIVQGIKGEGVLSGAGVTAQGSPDLTVAVASGTVIIAGAAVSVSSGNLSIAAGGSTNPRIDIVSVNSGGTKTVTSGTTAANPAPPAIPASSVLLAMVYVPALDTTIESNQITDKRVSVFQAATGLLKGSNSQIVAATAGTDYLAPTTPGVTRQTVSTISGAVATGTGTIPYDDTTPQITEGDQYMSLAITPTLATNWLQIDVVINISNNTNGRYQVAALFQDSTVNALEATAMWSQTLGENVNLKLTHHMQAATTSATTFRVRAGGYLASTTTFNGVGGARRFGGVSASSMTIREYVPGP